MPIKKSNELDLSNKRIAMLLYARPGSGKTTLALSANKPLLVDLEDGVDRVEACYRDDSMVAEEGLTDIQKYEMFINDLVNSDLSNYETIIIDTVGKFMELVTPVVIKESAVNGQKDGKTLSLKGYGAIAAKFREFTKLILSLNKDVIWIAHCTEVQDGDVIKTRINIPGSTKDAIWDDINLGGYLEFQGKDRVIHFTPTERYDAKGTHGIKGTYKISELKDTRSGGKREDNHFLADLIKTYKEDTISTQKQYHEDSVVYKEAMVVANDIKVVKTIEELNSVVEKIKTVTHALTSREELLSQVQYKAKELGAVYDKVAKRYIIATQE